MARHKILNAFAVPAAATFASDAVTIGEAGDLTAVFDFDYGSGGTSLDVWLQTSFDGGTNWYDLIHPAQFTTADNVEIYSVSAAGDLTTAPTEGSKALAAGTVQSGMIGDMLRVAGTVVGTYAASTITVIVESRQNSGGGGPVTIADGALVTLGAKADAAAGSGTVSVVALLKYVADLIKLEDAAHVSADKGVPVWAVRYAAPTDLSAGNTDGDYEPHQVDALGRTRVRVQCATATVTSVADQATSVTLLAANTSRVGATTFNDSTVNLYLKLGATASATSFTVLLLPQAYYEVPFGYTGIIDGIWASDASGSARMTELT